MPLTLEEIEAIEDENTIAEVIRDEEAMEMLKVGAFVPPMMKDERGDHEDNLEI